MSPSSKRIVSRSLTDIAIPGVSVEVDQDEAARLGAFAEDAITEADAHDSKEDICE